MSTKGEPFDVNMVKSCQNTEFRPKVSSKAEIRPVLRDTTGSVNRLVKRFSVVSIDSLVKNVDTLMVKEQPNNVSSLMKFYVCEFVNVSPYQRYQPFMEITNDADTNPNGHERRPLPMPPSPVKALKTELNRVGIEVQKVGTYPSDGIGVIANR